MTSMKLNSSVISMLAMTLCMVMAGCRAGSMQETDLPANTDAARITYGNDAIEISFPRVGDQGSFLQIPLDDNEGIISEDWSGDDELVHLSIVHEGILHVGACTRPGVTSEDVRLRIR